MYTSEQKELLLDHLFDGFVCLDIYDGIEIIHKNRGISYYIPESNIFLLNKFQIW